MKIGTYQSFVHVYTNVDCIIIVKCVNKKHSNVSFTLTAIPA